MEPITGWVSTNTGGEMNATTLGTTVLQAGGLGSLLWWIIVIVVVLAILSFVFGRGRF
jgi:hypothetical protein